MYGFVFSNDNYTALDGTYGDVNVPASMNNGVTPGGGLIAGLYTDMTGKGRAYLLSGSNFLPFDFPGSISTAAWGISPSGEVVGVYVDSGGKVHGFLMSHADFF